MKRKSKYANYRPKAGERFCDGLAIYEVEQVGFGPIVYMDIIASRDTELEEYHWHEQPFEGIIEWPLEEFRKDLAIGNIKFYDDGIERAIKRLK